MKHRILPQGLLAGLMLALAVLAVFSQVDPSAARPPLQGGGQPDFSLSIQTSPDNSATIESSEARLDPVYFAANGSMEGVTIAPAGLVLDEGQADGVYTSAVIGSPLAVTTDIVPLWQADLPPGAELRLETRLSLDNGESWSDWIENPEAYYPVRDDQRAGNLIWVGSERAALQFRVRLISGGGLSPTLRSLTLVFNDTSRGPTDGDIAALMAPVQAAQEPGVCPLEKPPVVSRTAWGCPDGQFSPRRPPTYAPVTHVIIHQAETPNHPSPYLDWAGWVRSVWHYHARVLWWGDVGYNYIIDPEGTIYEGRAGGDNVIGIHDTINRGSMAIGFLGCYGNCDDPRLSVAEPSQAMLDSAVALIAWKLDQQGIDPFSSGPYGPLSNVPVIAGGRDVTATTSPGDNLYNRLPELRAAVAEVIEQCAQPLAACQVADVIFDKPEYLVNDIINMTLKLVDSGGQPLGGAEVTASVERPAVTASQTDEFGLIDRTGDYDGSYSQTDTPGEYLFTFTAVDPTGTRFSPCSAQATVLVKPGGTVITPCQITLSLDRAQYQVGQTINFTATVNNGPGAVVTATVAGPGKPVFGPINLAGPGPYTGVYTDTTPAGSYLIAATATDPTGQNFLACSAQTTAQVLTSQPGVVVRVVPASLVMSECVVSRTTTIAIENVSGLRAIDLDIRFDPAVVRVVDANPGAAGVQIRPLGLFATSSAFVAIHQVDNQAGRIQFAATLVGSGLVNGNAGLIAIDWEPVDPGTGQIRIEQALLAGNDAQPISTSVEHGTVTVTPGCQGPIVGIILLQGRNHNGGVVVKNEQGQQVLTAADGSFSIGGSQISASFPGYLSAQASLDSSLAAGPAGLNLGQITLPAGDVNGDDAINIFDLAYLAGRYQSQDTTGDLNADGIVNILDLALAAGNYQQQGPLVNWK